MRRLEALDPSRIELGLERVRPVARALGVLDPPVPVITVAGTNGKGSTVAFADAIAGAAGLRVGAYLSPHVIRFNERVRVNGTDASDGDLVHALAAVEAARGDAALTYFEFITLAALWLFSRAELDLWVLEVGLGGRLDVVNVVDADVAVITSIGLDHQDWLGDDRDAIAREKAGILRAGRPVVCGETDWPPALAEILDRHDGSCWQLGQNLTVSQGSGTVWRMAVADTRYDDLPAPALAGGMMRGNATLAVAALCAAGQPPSRRAVADGVSSVRLPGRLQQLPGPTESWLDTAHNPQAARALGQSLAAMPPAATIHCVLGMLSDKDAAGVTDALLQGLAGASAVRWYCAALTGPRGLPAAELTQRAGVPAREFDTVADALDAARAAASASGLADRVVCFGSFLTVEAVLAHVG